MNRKLLNLVLVVVVAGLGALLYFTREKPKTETPLTTLAADAVDSIDIDPAGGKPPLKLARIKGSWQLTAPIKAYADDFAVTTLSGLASQTTTESYKVADVDPAEMGFSDASAKVKLNDQTLVFGGQDPLQGQRYVRNGDRITLIPDLSPGLLDDNVADLVSKHLLTPEEDPTRIELPGLTLVRGADDKWSSPEHADASSEQLEQLVDAWRDAQAMWNQASGTDQPQSSQDVVITTAAGATIHLTLVSQQPQLQISRADVPGVVYVLSAKQADSLLKLPAPAKPAADAQSGSAKQPLPPPDPNA